MEVLCMRAHQYKWLRHILGSYLAWHSILCYSLLFSLCLKRNTNNIKCITKASSRLRPATPVSRSNCFYCFWIISTNRLMPSVNLQRKLDLEDPKLVNKLFIGVYFGAGAVLSLVSFELNSFEPILYWVYFTILFFIASAIMTVVNMSILFPFMWLWEKVFGNKSTSDNKHQD